GAQPDGGRAVGGPVLTRRCIVAHAARRRSRPRDAPGSSVRGRRDGRRIRLRGRGRRSSVRSTIVPRSSSAAAPSALRRFEPLFTPATRARGIDYAARGQVRILRVTPEGIVAEVRGQQYYDVELHAAGGVLSASCTCPHFSGGDGCKHLWATLVVAEHDRKLPGGDLRSIVLDPPAGDPMDEGDDDEWDEVDGAQAARTSQPFSSVVVRPAPSPRSAPKWRDVLAA